MSRICSICATESMSLTPLLNRDKNFGQTGLSEMIKVCGVILIHKSNKYPPVICNPCIYKVSVAYNFHQTCQDLGDKLRLSPRKRLKHQNISTQTVAPKVTLIINGIRNEIQSEKLKSLFSNYGKVLDIYKCSASKYSSRETFVRITFSDEQESLCALEAVKRGELKLNGGYSAITPVSDFDTPIHVLTDDCLQQIFLLVPAETRLELEDVCQRWNRVAPLAWVNVTRLTDYLLHGLKKGGQLRKFMTRCGKSLTDVTLDLTNNSVECLNIVEKFCTNIENIEIGFDYDRPTQELVQYLDPIFRKNHKIRRVRLMDIDDDFCFDFLNNLSEDMIEMHLYAKHSRRPRNSSLDLSKFRNLQILSLEDFKLDAENDLRGVEFLNRLRYLRIYRANIHPNTIRKIENFRNLEHLEIPNQEISDNVLSKIMRNNQRLRCLDISSILHVSDYNLQCIVELPYLEHLTMKNLHHVNTLFLAQLSQIRTLNCNGCQSITDWELMTLIDIAPRLCSINVAGCPVTLRLIASAEESMKHHASSHRLSMYVSNPKMIENWQMLPDKSGKLFLYECRYNMECFVITDDWISINEF